MIKHTLSSSGQANKCEKVNLRFRANRGAKTSLSFPN